jgi:hypothetical protein
MTHEKEEIKTKFKGPGQWRSQAARLEEEAKKKEKKS